MKKMKFENLMAVCVLAVMLILFGAFLFGADILVVAGAIMAGAAVSLLAFVACRKLVAKYPGMGKNVRRLASTAAVVCVVVAFLAVTAYATVMTTSFTVAGATFGVKVQPNDQNYLNDTHLTSTFTVIASDDNAKTATVAISVNDWNCSRESKKQNVKYDIYLSNQSVSATDGEKLGASISWNFIDPDTHFNTGTSRPASGNHSWEAGQTDYKFIGQVASYKTNDGMDDKVFTISFTNIQVKESPKTVTWAAPVGSGSFTVDGKENQKSTTAMPGTTINLKATPAEGYELYCWLSVYNGVIDGSLGKAEYTYTIKGTDTVWPLFRATQTVSSTGEVLGAPALFMVKETKKVYTNLETALSEAASGQTVVLLASGVMTDSKGKPDSTITIPSGKKLLLPYDNRYVFRGVPKEYTLDQKSLSRKAYPPAPSDSEGSIITVPDEPNNPTVEYCRLTMAGGAELIVEGELEVSGQTQSSAKGHCGKYAQLQMHSGSKVTVKNQGKLYVYGFIKGSGSVEALSGSAVYEPFAIDDYPGGGVGTMDSMNNENVLAFNRYNIRNVEVPMTLHAGAQERIYVYITGWAVGNNGILLTLVGSDDNAILNLSSGTYTKSWENGRQKNVVNGQVVFNPFAITLTYKIQFIVEIPILTYTVDTAKTGMSLPDTWDLTIQSGKLKLAVDAKCQAGANITVNEGAEIEVVSGRSMYLFDAIDDPSNVEADCCLDVNGTVTVNGAIYATKNGAQIISSKGTGKVVIKNYGTMPTLGVKVHMPDGSDVVEQRELQPALLLNGNGTYLPITVDTFTYSDDLDRWFASGHTVDDWNITKAPTCEGKGERTGNCVLCGKIVTNEMPATGHSANAATCLEDSTCMNCGQKMADATGHNIEHLDCPEVSMCKNSCGYAIANPDNGHVPGEAATCTTDQVCTNCGGVVAYALGHTDENHDHICDVCGGGTSCADADQDHICDFGLEKISSCEDANKDHVCDYKNCDAAVAMDKHVDANRDHTCDYGCFDMIGQHLDTNHDHICEYEGCTRSIGYCIDQDRDHICDYGCGKTIGACEDTDHDHDCDHGCGKTFGDHADAGKDHACDYGCQVAIGTCADTDSDHLCDYGCGKRFGTCEDTDYDHACDYGCDQYYGEHTDAGNDHVCDYGCKVAIGTCADTDNDHYCNYGCGKFFGPCEDAIKDHLCDYGCGKIFGTCADNDYDHACDYGCPQYHGNHADAGKDHVCDYGCKETIGTCADTDKDHLCDYGCGKSYGTCADGDKDHYCDHGCGEYYGEHKDDGKDHKCDYGCEETIGTCEDADYDHDCDYGCDKVYGDHTDAGKDHVCDYGCKETIGTCEDKDNDHDCDYGCDKFFGTCADTDNDHYCNYGCGEYYGTCEDADYDHDCDYGCDKYHGTHADAGKDHACDYGCKETIGTCEDKDKDHDCDYGCDKVYGTHADPDGDGDHLCDYCEEKMTEHVKGEVQIENKKSSTCTVKGGHDEVIYCTECNEKLSSKHVEYDLIPTVATVNGTPYASLPEAVDAANDGDVIIMQRDEALPGRLTIRKNITLDLNGKTITADFNDPFGAIYVGTAGNLTVTGDGTVINEKDVVIANYGKVNIQGGTFISNAGNDGKYELGAALYNMYYDETVYGTATITGGTFSSEVWNSGILDVNGGTLNGLDNSGKTTITAGTINGVIVAGDGSDAEGVEGNGTITITGGLFQNPITDESWFAKGYDHYDSVDEDGYYGVHQHNFVGVKTDATCTEAGYTTYTCSACSDTYKVDGEPSLGHLDNDTDYKCDRCGGAAEGAVARIGDNYYGSVSSAIAKAGAGDTIVMVKNSDESGTMLVLYGGITLDLNGFDLTADGLTTFNGNYVIDSADSSSKTENTAALIVPEGNLTLPRDNAELPFWTGEYYAFLKPSTSAASNYQYFDKGQTNTNQFKLWFRPGLGYIDGKSVRSNYLVDGGKDNGLTMVLNLSWTNSLGHVVNQSFTYTDEHFAKSYQSGQMFYITVKGVASIGNITINAIVVSDASVEFVGEDIIYRVADFA